jgi:tetratricopeptide (TPR) repeat protein
MHDSRSTWYEVVRTRLARSEAGGDIRALQGDLALHEANKLVEGIAAAGADDERFAGPALALAIEFFTRRGAHRQSEDEQRCTAFALDLTRVQRTFPAEDLPQVLGALLSGSAEPQHSSGPTDLLLTAIELSRQAAGPGGTDRGRLDSYIEQLSGIVHMMSPLFIGWPDFVSNLVASLTGRFTQAGERQDLDAAVETAVSALDRGAHCRRHPELRLNGALALFTRYRETGDVADLARALALIQDGLDIIPTGHPRHGRFLREAALYSRARYDRTGEVRYLDECLAYLDRALAAADDPRDRVECLCARSEALQHRFEALGTASDVDQAVEAADRASSHAGHLSDRHAAMAGEARCRALSLRYLVYGDPPDIELAIEAGTSAAALDTSYRDVALEALGAAHARRYERSLDLADLDAAIEAQRSAIGEPGHRPGESTAGRHSALADILRKKFEHTGEPQLIEEAVVQARKALEATSLDSAQQPLLLLGLGLALRFRYLLDGSLADLDEAIGLGTRAVQLAPAGHLDQRLFRLLLTAALTERYDRTTGQADLDHAVDHARAALNMTPAGHHRRARALSGLLAVLSRRYREQQRQADYEEALAVGDQVLRLLPDDSMDSSQTLSNLAGLHSLHYGLTQDPTSFELADELLAQAQTLINDDDVRRHAILVNLSRLHRARAEFDGDSAAARQAAGYAVEAAAVTTAPLRTRVEAASEAGEIAAAQNWADDALRAYSTAVELLPVLAWQGLERPDQEAALISTRGLATEAAAWALQGGDTGKAAELLETGRAVLISRVLDNEGDLSRLRRTAPELADELLAVRRELETVARIATLP